jgi:hypothetical protein
MAGLDHMICDVRLALLFDMDAVFSSTKNLRHLGRLRESITAFSEASHCPSENHQVNFIDIFVTPFYWPVFINMNSRDIDVPGSNPKTTPGSKSVRLMRKEL